MAEFTFTVIPVGIDMRCDKCGRGVMRPDHGKKIITTPQGKLYPHRCTHKLCDNSGNFRTIYPRIEFKKIDDVKK